MKLMFLFVTITGLLLAGCGYELPKPGEPAENANRTTANLSVDSNQKNENTVKPAETSSDEDIGKEETEPLVFSETGLVTTIPCGGRDVEFEGSSTANTITLTGECKKLVVDGVSNRITVDKVSEIVVKGVSNKIIYGEGPDGKKPKISKSGTSTEINSKAEIEKKKAAEVK